MTDGTRTVGPVLPYFLKGACHSDVYALIWIVAIFGEYPPAVRTFKCILALFILESCREYFISFWVGPGLPKAAPIIQQVISSTVIN